MVNKVYSEKIEPSVALWELEIQEVDGKSMEKKGREEINSLLDEGWVILSIYTLRYKDADETWFERPMAILGLPKHPVRRKKSKKQQLPESVIL